MGRTFLNLIAFSASMWVSVYLRTWNLYLYRLGFWYRAYCLCSNFFPTVSDGTYTSLTRTLWHYSHLQVITLLALRYLHLYLQVSISIFSYIEVTSRSSYYTCIYRKFTFKMFTETKKKGKKKEILNADFQSKQKGKVIWYNEQNLRVYRCQNVIKITKIKICQKGLWCLSDVKE